MKYNVGIIRTACIYYNVYSNEKIDYYVERFSLNKNFIFPWRINRDCISLLTDVMQKNKEYDEYTLKNEIEKVYGVTLNPQIIINCLENKETIFNKKNGAWYILSD